MRNSQQKKMSVLETPYIQTRSNLFEVGYLSPENNSGVRSLSAWRDREDVGDAFDKVAAILTEFERKHVGQRPPNESTTEAKCVDKVLTALGWHTALRAVLPDREYTADLSLFADEGKMQEVKDEAGSARYWNAVTAICEGKRWGLSFEHDACRKDSPPSLNPWPVHQIMCYLHLANVEWGILTNGIRWRLYHQERSLPPKARHKNVKDVSDAIRSAPSSEFPTYEVDLVSLVNRENRGHFDYFVNFFAPTAYVHNPASKARLVDLSLRGSEKWRKREEREQSKKERDRERRVNAAKKANEEAREAAYKAAHEAACELARSLRENKLIVDAENGVRSVLEAAYSKDVVKDVLENVNDPESE